MRRSFSDMRGALLLTKTTNDYLESLSLQQLFEAHQNLRLNRHNKRRRASEHCASCGPIDSWTNFPTHSGNVVFHLPCQLSWEHVRRDKVSLRVSLLLPSYRVISQTW